MASSLCLRCQAPLTNATAKHRGTCLTCHTRETLHPAIIRPEPVTYRTEAAFLNEWAERDMPTASETMREIERPFAEALANKVSERGSRLADLVVKISAEIPDVLRSSSLNGRLTKARPSWDAYYLAIARDVASRVTCPAGQVGCVIVSAEGVPVMFGYNGAPSGVAHCDEAGCSWVSRTSTQGEVREYPRHVHAEANAIARAARVGARLDRSTLYVTQEPCPECLKLCLQAGVRAIVVGSVKDRKWFEQAASICETAGILWGEGTNE